MILADSDVLAESEIDLTEVKKKKKWRVFGGGMSCKNWNVHMVEFA